MSVVDVTGFAQSAALGISEVMVGLVLIAGAACVWNRASMGSVGIPMLIGGIVIAAALPVIVRSAHRVDRTA